MSAGVFFYLLSGGLLAACAAIREWEVPPTGSIGRGRLAHVLWVCLLASLVAAAALTYRHLIDLST
ncbi:hypothetical protein FK531_04620 [Rhodococcus spelaei]|uniref:Uncharacterized protein n=1 Tax=Rhodococcus spelaei TaxID=2546320 RepID=A0A541BNQ7_9NOCA|nr:hypothetical protein [Rhodococcus spelaei]TQF73961.1 hypothetical protein FK531_04620 [Rhodococcus spelaei]